MKIIPLIYFQKRKIYAEKEGEALPLKELIESVEKDKDIYVYDKDGIEQDKPNLCTYPKLSERYSIWVDYGPRNLGDVVDAVMAGATNIVLRKNLWPKAEISRIRDLTENTIYEIYDSKDNQGSKSFFSLSTESEGFVIPSNKNGTEKDFIYDDVIKTICKKFNVYIIEHNEKLFSYWKKMGVSGLFIELNKWKKVKQDGF